MKIDYKLFY